MEQKNPFNWLMFFLLICTIILLFITIASSERYSGKIRQILSGPLPKDTRLDNSSFVLELPAPRFKSTVSVEETLLNRRSRRTFTNEAVTKKELSQILWAAYGVSETDPGKDPKERKRTTPSAGAFYPLEIYALIGNITGIAPGVYKYIPVGHKIVRVIEGDIREQFRNAAYTQEMIGKAPVCLVYCAVYERSTRRFGERTGKKVVYIEAGHSAQNVYLQTEALGLGACVAGGFNAEDVKNVMQLPEDENPLYLMVVGKTR